MEETAGIDKAWHRLIDGGPYWYSDHPVFRAAQADSTLRKLFPFPSHGTLSFYQTVWPPQFDQPPVPLGFIVCSGPPYSVYSSDYDQLVGRAATAEEAVTVLVASLAPPASLSPRRHG